jgi:PAS domain S-box-containing protein
MTHVLVVDDIDEARYLLKALLEGNGYRVTIAGNGLEALAAARADAPDVIVSDALMPTMDGFALCRAWVRDDVLKAIPFIFYSATYTSPEDEKLALALGAVRYLIKPQEPEVFLDELSDVLKTWAKRPVPEPAAPLDDSAFAALHDSVLARKLESKLAKLANCASCRRPSSKARKASSSPTSMPHRVRERAFVRNTGYSRDEVIGQNPRMLQSGKTPPETYVALWATLTQGQPWKGEFHNKRKDGSEYVEFAIITPLRQPDGTISHYVAVKEDITEKKRVGRNWTPSHIWKNWWRSARPNWRARGHRPKPPTGPRAPSWPT